jgi:hypothetical protein
MTQRNLKLKSAATTMAAALTLAFSATAQADLIDGIVDEWTVDVNTRFDTNSICDSTGDCTSPTGVTVINDKTLRWGDSAQSGLNITDSPSQTTVETNGPAVGNVSVTHLNQPITGTTLSSVDILSTLTLTPSDPLGSGLAPATITFKINFAETPNGADPCADGGANGAGVNENGCADIFVIDQNSLNFPFFYDLDGAGVLPNQQYFISFFELTGGLIPLPVAACTAASATSPCLGFRTPEDADTTFQFAALITTEPVSIPEPGALALMGLGIGLMGLLHRRRRSV